jgi:hypothetical protein
MIIQAVSPAYWSKAHEKNRYEEETITSDISRRAGFAPRREGCSRDRTYTQNAHLCLEGRQGRRRETVKQQQTGKAMAYGAKKTEHGAPEESNGASYGRKAAAKKASSRRCRENDKRLVLNDGSSQA